MIPISNYSLNLIFGRKGCGKSSCIARLARTATRRHIHVYTSIQLDLSKFKSCDSSLIHYFEGEDFGHFVPLPNSLILIDEINVLWDNRDYKSFDKLTQKFFRYQRHFRCTVVCFSQSFDCDKKIRSLTDNLYIMKKIKFPFIPAFFSCITRIDKFIYIVPPDKGTSDIVEAYEKARWYDVLARTFVLFPRYRGCFDSFCTYPLPTYEEFYHKDI